MANPSPALRFDIDPEDVKLFSDEADDQLSLLERSLVELDGDPPDDLVQRIFRAAHTLKGSAATIGHQRLASLAHAMETVLDAVRQGRAAPRPAMVDALLAATDALGLLAAEVATGVPAPIDTGPLELALALAIDSSASPATYGTPPALSPPSREPSSEARAAAEAANRRGQRVFMVDCTVEESCPLPSIRAYQVFQALDADTSIHQLWPDRPVVESGGAGTGIAALCSTDLNAAELYRALSAIPDLASTLITAWSDGGSRAGTGPAAAIAEQPHELQPRQAAAASPAPAPQGHPSASIRIDVQRVDTIMNLVGELVVDRARLQRVQSELGTANGAGRPEVNHSLVETTTHLGRITDELQDEIMLARMVSLRALFGRLPRVVRDVAARSGKEVELTIAGEDTELDRAVVEELADPLVHLIRNAVDHGIEDPSTRRAAGKAPAGHITVAAWSQGTSIYVTVRDDGGGIDAAALRTKALERGLVTRQAAGSATDDEVLQYVFLPGLSTAPTLSDISGRGVGMDIVRTNVERLQGTVSVSNSPGRGAEFLIQLPLTLATVRALLATSKGVTCAIPLVSVTVALSRSTTEEHRVAGHTALRLEDRIVPVVALWDAFGQPPDFGDAEGAFIVVVGHGEALLGLSVDALVGEQEVVVKPLGGVVGLRSGLLGPRS